MKIVKLGLMKFMNLCLSYFLFEDSYPISLLSSLLFLQPRRAQRLSKLNNFFYLLVAILSVGENCCRQCAGNVEVGDIVEDVVRACITSGEDIY